MPLVPMSVNNVPTKVDEDYLTKMSQDGCWGDGIVLAAACRLYHREIRVLMVNGNTVTFADGQPQTAVPLLMGFVKSVGSSTEDHYVYLQKKVSQQAELPRQDGM